MAALNDWREIERDEQSDKVQRVFMPEWVRTSSPIARRAWPLPAKLDMKQWSPRIMLMGEDHELRGLLAFCLKRAGHDVTIASDPSDAIQQIEQGRLHLVVLDCMADGSELALVQQIRTRSHVPIIVLGPGEGDANKARGLGLGANDYLPKPFSIQGLLTSVRTALRHLAPYREQWHGLPDSVLALPLQ